ncbi:NADH:flavin oxidoreductase/NADH oxidase [Brevibacterium album]|uniref:NADH:flavin oxidoreductase/NADH oxidase n=1 Tax=Brevibacterium album TaxID=417948 RepID=UPI00040643C6|nr:NADH:flavin oxidoreductase/NADH oxidase [Brevibacterium album]
MPRLFEPLTLRGLTVKNRVWLPPLCQYSCEAEDGVPTDWHLVHLGARAQGGFGLVIAEASAVVPEGRISLLDAGIWNDEQARAWTRVVDFVHSQDAAIAIQLAHAGRKASTHPAFHGGPKGSLGPEEGAWQTYGPSAVPFPDLAVPAEMSTEQIAEVVEAFAAAAARAQGAGFDAVEIHAAHGYLLHEFLSPLSNLREDGYGGDFAGRSRFVMEVYRAVRAAVGEDFPVMVRISATEWTEGGFGPDEAVELAALLDAEGCDLIDVSSAANVPAQIPVGPGYQVPLAAEVAGTGATTAAVGLITEPAQAEQVLVSGDADVVLIGRAALREPAWPQRAAHQLGMEWRDIPYPRQYTRGRWGAGL